MIKRVFIILVSISLPQIGITSSHFVITGNTKTRSGYLLRLADKCETEQAIERGGELRLDELEQCLLNS
jgi:hypothetical protein